jgi:hypothetical protein
MTLRSLQHKRWSLLLVFALAMAPRAQAQKLGDAPQWPTPPPRDASPDDAPPEKPKQPAPKADKPAPKADPKKDAGHAPPVINEQLDFDLLGPQTTISPEEQARRDEVQHQLVLRRKFINVHQTVGFALLAGMATTVVLGQLNFADKYGGGGDTGKYITAHATSAYVTTGLFATAGLIALFAPKPVEQPQGISRSTLHKTAMAVATAGFVAEIALGILAAHNEGQESQRNYALAHQINGYVTAAAIATGFVVLVF